MEKQGGILVEKKSLLTGLRLVKHVMATGQSRKDRPICGLFHIYSEADGSIVVVATDAYRLAKYTASASVEGEFKGLFPLDLLPIVRGMTGNEIRIVILVDDSGKKVAEINDRKLELASGVFPDMRQFLRSDFSSKATFSIKEMMRALGEIKDIAEESGGIVKIETTEENAVRISAGFIGEQSTAKELRAQIEGDPGRIGLRWKHLWDAVKTGADKMSFNGPHEMCFLTGIPGLTEVMCSMPVVWPTG